jgi:hypothetical protein
MIAVGWFVIMIIARWQYIQMIKKLSIPKLTEKKKVARCWQCADACAENCCEQLSAALACCCFCCDIINQHERLSVRSPTKRLMDTDVEHATVVGTMRKVRKRSRNGRGEGEGEGEGEEDEKKGGNASRQAKKLSFKKANSSSTKAEKDGTRESKRVGVPPVMSVQDALEMGESKESGCSKKSSLKGTASHFNIATPSR